MLNLTPIPTQDYNIIEPFGVKGLAEIMLRAMLADGVATLDFAYSTANLSALRRAASRITEASKDSTNGNTPRTTFTFEKLADDWREITYAVKRGEKEFTITRKFANTLGIRVTHVQAQN